MKPACIVTVLSIATESLPENCNDICLFIYCRFRSNVTREVTDLGEVLRKKMGIEEMPVMAMMMPRMGFSAGGMKGKRGAAAGKTEEKSEKAVFDLNLEGGFDAGAKIKIINEVIFY